MWGRKLSNPAPLFSSHDYFRNIHFQRCLRNWNIYLESDEGNDEILAEWEEVLLKDFLTHGREWLKRCGDQIFWRVGLE